MDGKKVKISTVQTAMDGCLNGKRKGHKVFHAFFGFKFSFVPLKFKKEQKKI